MYGGESGVITNTFSKGIKQNESNQIGGIEHGQKMYLIKWQLPIF